MEQLDLSGFFLTRQQATDFSTRLAAISAQIYETAFDLDKILLEQLGIQKKDKFLTLLRHNSVPLDSHILIKGFIEKIQEKISTMPVLNLTIAFDPNEKTLRSFSEWFLVNANAQVLLDIHINPSLIAGAVISINGKFYDFSVRPKFNAVLQGVVAAPSSPPPEKISYTPLAGYQSGEHITLGR